VNDKVQLQKVETWFDPLEMFRQIAPKGIVNKQVVASATDFAPAMEEEQIPGFNSNMTPKFESKGSGSGERPLHNEDSGTVAASSAQNTGSVGSKHGTKRGFTSEESSTIDRTTSSDVANQSKNTTSSAHQEANQDPRSVHHGNILSSPKQAPSPLTEQTINDQGHNLDQPPMTDSTASTSHSQNHTLPTTLLPSPPSAVHADEAQVQLSNFTAGACPFFTGPVPFGGAMQAATDDSRKVKEQRDSDEVGAAELVDKVGLGVASASAEGSNETNETREEMGTIEQREREGMNKE